MIRHYNQATYPKALCPSLNGDPFGFLKGLYLRAKRMTGRLVFNPAKNSSYLGKRKDRLQCLYAGSNIFPSDFVFSLSYLFVRTHVPRDNVIKILILSQYRFSATLQYFQYFFFIIFFIPCCFFVLYSRTIEFSLVLHNSYYLDLLFTYRNIYIFFSLSS